MRSVPYSGSISQPGGSNTSTRRYTDRSHHTAATPQAIAAPTRQISAPAVVQIHHPQEMRPSQPFVHYTPLPFHPLTGRSVIMSQVHTIAERSPDEVTNAYVFTERPIYCGETFTIEIVSTSPLDEELNTGGLAFGMTTCDPATLTPGELPDDSDYLLDRPEYWIVNKDICLKPRVGDKLSFHLTLSGRYSFVTHYRTCSAYIFPVVINFPIDVSAHAR